MHRRVTICALWQWQQEKLHHFCVALEYNKEHNTYFNSNKPFSFSYVFQLTSRTAEFTQIICAIPPRDPHATPNSHQCACLCTRSFLALEEFSSKNHTCSDDTSHAVWRKLLDRQDMNRKRCLLCGTEPNATDATTSKGKRRLNPDNHRNISRIALIRECVVSSLVRETFEYLSSGAPGWSLQNEVAQIVLVGCLWSD